jgi:hypothetical protein
VTHTPTRKVPHEARKSGDKTENALPVVELVPVVVVFEARMPAQAAPNHGSKDQQRARAALGTDVPELEVEAQNART